MWCRRSGVDCRSSTAAPAGDPETDRYRLFEAVVTLLGAIAASAPLLLVLDDLHWADRPTLQLLRHLIRSPQAARVKILGAYRLGESLPAALESAVAELGRDGLLRTLRIGGLPESEATELVALRAGGTPPQGLMRALYVETEGSPLFLQEIVRHLVDSGVTPDQAGPGELARVGLPEGVRGLISRRLGRVTPDCLEWLRVASVIGPEFDGELLEACWSSMTNATRRRSRRRWPRGWSSSRRRCTVATCSPMP